MIRKPIVAGQFYEFDSGRLKNSIRKCFETGPGMPSSKASKAVKGVISPHAGYVYSGIGAAYVFKEIAESKKPDLYILLGLSHAGFPSCTSLQDFETPLGVLKNDIKFTERLIRNGIKDNNAYQQQEHSIEVQLPFLQSVDKDARFTPVIVSDDYENIATIIRKSLQETGRKAIIIASSDFTHYGFSYGYAPFSDNIKENMYKLDKGAIEFIKQLDSKGFLNYISRTDATICGRYPIACLLELVKDDKPNVKLLKYYTSADIMGEEDYSTAVGYASIVIEITE